jgi:hypothetical protein
VRVLVCGGRELVDRDAVFGVLDGIHRDTPISHIIHGCARGADLLADAWGHTNNVILVRFPADWHRLGRKAGPIRNQLMLEHGKPDLVVAFPGGRGTSDMVKRAVAGAVAIHRVVEMCVETVCLYAVRTV